MAGLVERFEQLFSKTATDRRTGRSVGTFEWWSGPASIRGPTAFQAVALPTELPDQICFAVPTRFELATSALTGRRELLTSPRDLVLAHTVSSGEDTATIRYRCCSRKALWLLG